MSALLLAALLLTSSRLLAQAPGDQDSAIELYGKGRDTLAQGKPAEALPLLERSYGLLSSPNTELLMAHANRDLGHNVKALELYRRAEKNARDEIAKGQTRYGETADEAQRAGQALEKLVGTLVVKAPAGARTEVYRADGDVAVITGPGQVWVEPGQVRVVVTSADDKQDRTVVASAGAVTEVEFLASAQVTPPPEESSGFGALSIAGGVVGGVGIVGLALFAGFGTSAQSTYAQLDDCDHDPGCDMTIPEADDLRDDGTRAQTIANVSLGVGLTLVAAGTVMIIIDAVTGSSDPDPRRKAALPLLSVTPDGWFAGISLPL